MEEKSLIKSFIYIFNFLLPNIAFIIIPSPNSIIPSLTLMGKGLIFLLYLIPTFLFIGYIKKNKISFNEFKISDFKFKALKKVRSSFIVFLFSIVVGIYLLSNEFWYVGLPIIFMAIELIICIILDFKVYIEKQLNLDIMFEKQQISLEELDKYDKWKGFKDSIIGTLAQSICIITLLFLPKTYFNLRFDTTYRYLIYCVIFIYIFIDGIPFEQILDCKNNSFIKAKGICSGYERPTKGRVGHHIVKIVGLDMTLSLDTGEEVYENEQVVTVIFGLHSEQVIGFY